MIEELTKSIKADLYERVASPLFGAFSISWIIWNWKFLLALTSSLKLEEKINFIDGTLYHGWVQPFTTLFLAPLVSAVVFIFLYPIPAKYVFKHVKEVQKDLKVIKVNVEENTPLSQVEHNKLRQKVAALESSYYAELAKKDAEIERLMALLEPQGTSKVNRSIPKPQEKMFPLTNTEQPVITEVTIAGEVYRLGEDFSKSKPGQVDVLKLRNEFDLQQEIDVSFKTSKPLIEGQFYNVFDGYSQDELHEQHFVLRKTDYESKNAFIVVSQPNPARGGQQMVISNKVQFPY